MVLPPLPTHRTRRFARQFSCALFPHYVAFLQANYLTTAKAPLSSTFDDTELTHSFQHRLKKSFRVCIWGWNWTIKDLERTKITSETGERGRVMWLNSASQPSFSARHTFSRHASADISRAEQQKMREKKTLFCSLLSVRMWKVTETATFRTCRISM